MNEHERQEKRIESAFFCIVGVCLVLGFILLGSGMGEDIDGMEHPALIAAHIMGFIAGVTLIVRGCRGIADSCSEDKK